MSERRHVLLYDGVCVLCNRLNGFILPRDPQGKFGFASIQGHFARQLLEKYGRNVDDLDTFYCVANYGTPHQCLLSRASAGIFVLQELGGIWRLAVILKVFPLPLLNALYNLVARNRYRIFGRYDTCLMPNDTWKERFMDVSDV